MPNITINEAEKEWGQGKTRPVYYFSGAERAIKEHSINKIKPTFKPEPFNFSLRLAQKCNIRDFLDEARTVPMLANIRFLVLKDAEELKKEDLDLLLEYIASPCETTCLILTAAFTGADPIAKILPISCAEISCPLMNEEKAEKYLNELLFNEVKSDAGALTMIVDTAGTSIAALDNEAEKIKTYMHGSEKEFFTEADAAELCGFSRQVKPFEFSNQIMAQNRPAAIKTAETLLASGEEPLRMVATISSIIEKMLSVKKSSKDEVPYGMVSARQANLYRIKAAAYTESKLIHLLHRCLSIESELKSSNKLSPSVLIRQLIIEVTAK